MRLLYLSNINWNWTKQRPQFLAEELSKHYQLTYVQRYRFHSLPVRNESSIIIKELFRLPLSRFKIVKVINNLGYKIQLFFSCRRADIIWFTSPEMYACVPEALFRKKITVYDCMDDMIELYPRYKEMAKHERLLFQKASIVLCSSLYLSDKLQQRYGDREISVINNAVSSSFMESSPSWPIVNRNNLEKDSIVMTYIGSISSWMDFNLLERIHHKFPQIKICLWGPHDVEIPEGIGIDYRGVTEHKNVAGILSRSDILIMPFVVNELIKSVNPVKLYEYIYSGKPCLAPKYGESLQFNEFVYLYDSYEDCLVAIDGMIKGEVVQKPQKQCADFVKKNTWANRCLSIVEAIQRHVS